jgi:hypothetical protein
MSHIPELEVVSIPAAQVHPGMVLTAFPEYGKQEPHVVDSVTTAGNTTTITVVSNLSPDPYPVDPEPLTKGYRSFAPVEVLADRTVAHSEQLSRYLWNGPVQTRQHERASAQSERIAALVNGPTLPAERWTTGPTPHTPRLPVDRGYER